MKTLHKIIKRAGAVLLHNEVANMKLQQLFEQVVAQNPPFATTLIFNLYEDSARFTVEAHRNKILHRWMMQILLSAVTIIHLAQKESKNTPNWQGSLFKQSKI